MVSTKFLFLVWDPSRTSRIDCRTLGTAVRSVQEQDYRHGHGISMRFSLPCLLPFLAILPSSATSHSQILLEKPVEQAQTVAEFCQMLRRIHASICINQLRCSPHLDFWVLVLSSRQFCPLPARAVAAAAAAARKGSSPGRCIGDRDPASLADLIKRHRAPRTQA